MPKADGIQANLVCNGMSLNEYPTASSAPNTVFCESTPGQAFEVVYTGPRTPSDCIVKLLCDGVRVKGTAFRRHENLSQTIRGIYSPTDDTKLMPFKFTNIELCEEDDSHPEQIVKNLGTVSLEFFHCILGRSKKGGKDPVQSLASNSKFSERNKKASMIPHTISLGESITVPKRSVKSSTHKQMDEKPYLRFVWQYRSRGMLITAGVIPRPISPLPDVGPPNPSVTLEDSESSLVQVPEPRVKERKPSICVNRGGDIITGPSTRQDTKPNIKPKTSSGKSVVIDLCDDDNQPIWQFSSASRYQTCEDRVGDSSSHSTW
ncbi:uncharacterized protein MELLADRAFT_84634 [Melampsora larici-populina 98AG31]|uniref:DUF7918 domain-containing protein n=1 Tax=Melampsora larici-populina (strain 98AG31 / pathotype 3-4-7) TaxID=747676 RepID=F4RFZ1_MELLP|nr:uncharacterized protein MELLADRAFT_84634 [Melampsora larici-populina 98AG31]EGG08457.1 hypothetical protein MELLADRAFT_84634 [Melampsora larici-populina 98AG31]